VHGTNAITNLNVLLLRCFYSHSVSYEQQHDQPDDGLKKARNMLVLRYAM